MQATHDTTEPAVTLKTCTKCGTSKSLTEFSKDSRNKDGLQPSCKACRSAHARAYNKANAEMRREYGKAYRAANREKRRKYDRAYYEANAERERERCRAYRAANPEKRREIGRAWREANPEKQRECTKAWRAANPDKCRANRANRRAREMLAGGTFTSADIENLLTLQKSKCAICRASIKKGHHIDHIVPLALDGTNDRFNLQLLCPACNFSKNAKCPIQFMNERGYLL